MAATVIVSVQPWQHTLENVTDWEYRLNGEERDFVVGIINQLIDITYKLLSCYSY
jgi:hypothetical protein